MYFKRKLEGTILQYIDVPEIIAIIGPRQAGKTTLMKRICEKTGSENFISFEDVRILDMFENDLPSFIGLYVEKKKFLFIDEFQHAKNGGKKLKFIFDHHKTKIFLSGSSAIDLTINAVKHLVGRIFIFDLLTADFEEFIEYKDKDLADFLKRKHAAFAAFSAYKPEIAIDERLSRHYDDYLVFGGYPRVLLADSAAEKKEVLKNIYNTYFLRDVSDALGLAEDFKLNKLIKALALQIGNMIEYRELSDVAELSFATLKKYLNFLEKTYICSFAKPYFGNKRLEIVKNPKAYFFDTGFRNTVADDFRPIDGRNDAGALLENGAYIQLMKNGRKADYWRTKKGMEIDFIVPMGEGKTLAIEVKNIFRNKVDFTFFNSKYPEIKDLTAYRKPGKQTDMNAYPIFSVY